MPGCVTLRGAMNYDIVATLGPSSSTPAIWQGMLDAGATAFRLNTSHLTLPQLQQWLDQLTPFLVGAETNSTIGARSARQQVAAG